MQKEYGDDGLSELTVSGLKVTVRIGLQHATFNLSRRATHDPRAENDTSSRRE